METVCGLKPLGSSKWVADMPSLRAVALRRATKVSWLPDTHRARVSARLFADGSISPSRSARSLSRSPACTGSEDPSTASALSKRATSALVMVSIGPSSPTASGCAWRTTSAVIVFATDPTGRTTAGAREARREAAPAPDAGDDERARGVDVGAGRGHRRGAAHGGGGDGGGERDRAERGDEGGGPHGGDP